MASLIQALVCLLLVGATVRAQYDTVSQSCGADDFRCQNGKCIESSRRCDRVVDCPNEEDEQQCECREGEFQCVSDGSCIEGRKQCDGVNHCMDSSDERDCEAPPCPPDYFTCDASSSVKCAHRCDGQVECDGGEDEDQCDECSHQCDGVCLDEAKICNGVPDCSDGSDEVDCDHCDRPTDYRCKNGECINSAQYCNGIPECSDESDEENCNKTMISRPVGCTNDEFQCRNGACINSMFFCDGNSDCTDNSDEENCPCNADEFQCATGQCLPPSLFCDGTPDCPDASDEVDCQALWTTPGRYDRPQDPTPPPTTTTTRRVFTTQAPIREQNPNEYDYSGIYSNLLPPQLGPLALNLKTYPSEQVVRNAIYPYGGDVVFQCRDEGPKRAPVRWIREGGRPLKPGSTDKNGRLDMNQVTTADSGTYICQAINYLGSPGSEVRVVLNVDSSPVTHRPRNFACEAFEATCGNGQCIPKSAVCNGVVDCADRSDEDNCYVDGKCQPNEFKCNNNKCVLKTWQCDSENDCGDDSDELNCEHGAPGQCRTVEFACASNDQCVPKSFHCDGQSDCIDGTDEIGCSPVRITSVPKPSNVFLNVGDTLVLNCSAAGIPAPLITWRRNWGDVPETCTMQNQNYNGQVVGILTCTNMLPDYNGAYSCEAMNNKGTVFAVPDAIVFVNQSNVCPTGYFNSEARSERECIRCFCFGESTQCHSADLFTYNMATPLGEGGTRLVGVKNTANGDVQMDTQPITEQYYYQPLRNGATVTKLARYNTGWGWSSALPYLTLPESYNSNQLTSYGGHIRYRVTPHNYGPDVSGPDVIIKGKYQTLVHYSRGSQSQIEARLTPENWQKPSSRGPMPATREDIMMALDDIEMILLRASVNNAGVNITDFVMESARHINMGLGVASLVEECTCPPGYEGLSCQKCAPGYSRSSSGPWLGECVRDRPTCPAGTYGDPANAYACRPCPCPLTNRENQFASSCALRPDGNVVCDCAAGYEGVNCEYCAPGYIGNPLLPGDSCRPKPSDICNPVGTIHERLLDDCECKDNVQGRYCDQCKNDSFYLSSDFRQGCALCFCSGVSQQCSSSSLRRSTSTVLFNTPDIVNRIRVYNSAPLGGPDAARYNAPKETNLTAVLAGGEVTLTEFDRSKPTIYYWSLPVQFAGDKVTSYGGYLSYTLSRVPFPGGGSFKNNAADVQLISDNRLTFHYFGDFEADYSGNLEAKVQFLEKGWQRPDGKEVSREHFLLALADVKAILIKATYTNNAQVASLVSASIDTAEPNGNGPAALHVEQCVCPRGYIGTSCEDCAPGFTRYESGLYLEHCGPCECNGHSSMCHPETGVCLDCQHNTYGDNCDQCKPGYKRDRANNCVPDYGQPTQPAPPQYICDPRGAVNPYPGGPCDCKQNVEGPNCDICRRGTFGLDGNYSLGCYDCYCSGVTTDCYEASSQYYRIPMAAPIFGPDYGGYKLMDLNAERVLSDHIVSMPLNSELMYVFDFPPDEELYWSLPNFPGNRVLSYGGTLQLKQKFESRAEFMSEPGTDIILVGDDKSVYWTNSEPMRVGQQSSLQVPLTESNWFLLNYATPASRSDLMSVLRDLRRVLVRATLVRNIESTSIADVSMDTAGEQSFAGPLDSSPRATSVEVCMCPEGYSGTSCESCTSGHYRDRYSQCQRCPCSGHDCYLAPDDQVVCNCRPPYAGRDCSTIGGESSKVSNATSRPPPPRPTVMVTITSPTIKIQEVGSSVNFTCQAESRMTRAGLPITWSKVDGHLPQGRTIVDDQMGMLLITNLQVSDSGKYVCQTNDGISTAQAYATLKVPGNDMTIPGVEIRPPINEYFEGDRVQLECVSSGNPAPQITWQRASGRPLPTSVETIDDLLIIEYAREEDSGEYRCIASNTLGSADRTALVTVRARPASGPRDRLTVSQSSPTLSEGQNTRVTCTGTANVPAGSIDWVRQDGTELQSNVRSENGVLYIDYAQLTNQGVYVCQTTAYDVQPVRIVVAVIPQGTPSPEDQSNITVSVDRLRIPTGGSGSVECTPRGYPLPLISWKKYNGKFGDGVSQRQNTLIIRDAREEDQDYYLCEGIVDGRPVANIYVYVEVEKREEPQIEIWPSGEQAVTLGSPFELRCRVRAGVPEPTVTWSRNGGRPIAPHAQIQPNNILKFERIEVNDEGSYSCSASNAAGTATASTAIKVRSPPELSVMPGDYVQAAYRDPVTVECRASGYPLPMVTIKKMQLNPEMLEIVPPSAGMAVLHIASVSEADDGNYVCIASSPAGTITEEFGIRVDRGDGGFGRTEGSGDDGMRQYDTTTGYPSGSNNQQPNSLIAMEGQTSRIFCTINSGDYDVRWSRDRGMPLQANAEQSGEALIIRNASKADAGYYTCDLYDRYTGEVQSSAMSRLVVLAPPRITLRPRSQTVRPGESPVVECIVDGDDIQEVTWRPVTRPLSSRVEIDRSRLIFNRIEVEDAGEYECFARNAVANSSSTAEVIVSGPRDETPLVSIEQPRSPFRVGDNVDVLCRASFRGVSASWERYGTRQYVESREYGDGALLRVPNVQESDAGVYRCKGDFNGRSTFEDFNLEVQPGNSVMYPENPSDEVATYQARLGEDAEMPCIHNLEEPVSIEWRRQYTPLQPEVRAYEPNLRLHHITESDAGTYVCRASNSRVSVETRAVLRVVGVVPSFDGNGWIALPALKDPYKQFDIELSFKPSDANGLILYNSDKNERTGDFVALQLVDGVPQFVLDIGAGALTVHGDRPLQLNAWHTVRISKTNSRVIMDVDNNGPSSAVSTGWELLELAEPLYIGGVPDLDLLPAALAGASGFMGCISMLILGREEKNIMLDSIDQSNVRQCDSCFPNLCSKNGVCQEARNERGYVCLCAAGFAGLNCDGTGEACRPGLCGPGRCIDTAIGYKCACPVTFTGNNCDVRQNIEYPAFTGSAYLAVKAPLFSRVFRLAMKVKAAAPLSDGIIMYCAESRRGNRGFTALTVHDSRLQFIYDLADGSRPVVLTSNRTLPANEWTDVYINRVGQDVSLRINNVHEFKDKLDSAKTDLNLETPLFVGGVDDSIVLNKNIGVTGGFSGCIKEVMVYNDALDIVGSSIQSANVQECSNYDRGDIPEIENVCSQCRNGGECTSDGAGCLCPAGFAGRLCESRVPWPARRPPSDPWPARRPPSDPCAAQPCRNGGSCRPDASTRMNYTCNCPLGFAGANCQMPLELFQSVGFNGNGYLELPAQLLRYDNLEREAAQIVMAFNTNGDGVLLYQREVQQPVNADYILLKVENGVVVLDWDLGSGQSTLTIEDVYVTDGDRHTVIARFSEYYVSLTVDSTSKNGTSAGFSNRVDANSNIYIGGIPSALNVNRYSGLNGCVEQVELMGADRGIHLGRTAVAGRNTQRCRNSRP